MDFFDLHWKGLVDKLLADYKKPENIIGENGLLKQLTKALLKHDPAGNNSGNSRNGATILREEN